MTWPRVKATKEYLLKPRPCKTCGQMLSAEYLKEKQAKRGTAIRDALLKSQAEGNHIGRKTVIMTTENLEIARRLRSQGWSYRRIGAQLGCSYMYIRRVIRLDSEEGHTDERVNKL